MSWQLPSLAALRTFEAAARHLSFTRAATELNLTQSAVSRQIRQMEEYLGVLLFQRVQKRLVLTDAGQSYVKDIRAALEQMQAATVNLLAHQGKGGIIHLATPPAFCVKWLIPRLSAFSAQFPNIFVNLSTRAKPFDFNSEPFDAAIYYGGKDWPGVVSEKLVGEELLVVCSEDYLHQQGGTGSVHDIGRYVLLQQTSRQTRWQEWMDRNGVHGPNALTGLRFEHLYMVMQAAIAGLGVGLLPRILVQDEIASGRLVMPFGESGSFVCDDAYCLVYPEAKKGDPKLDIFRNWILREAAGNNESQK